MDMRTVAAKASAELPQLETVLTARVTPAKLRTIWPEMEQADELASPGPTGVAHLQLSSGHEAVVVVHDRADFVEILAPIAAGVEVGLADLLVEIAVEPDAIIWTHDEIDRHAVAALYRSATSSDATVRNVVTPLFRTSLGIPSATTPRTRARRTSSLQAPAAREEHATEIYRKYYPRLVRFVRTYRLSTPDAEDLAQEAFIRFYQSLQTYRGDAEWPLLETVARSVLFNKFRADHATKRGRAATIDLDSVKSSAELSLLPDYADHADVVLQRKRLHDAIAALPSGQRQCIQLWLDGFSYMDIAKALAISSDAVKSRLRDAKKHLRDRLEDEFDHTPRTGN